MAVEPTKQNRVPTTLPPHTIDVHKFAESRASELETLHSIVSNRLENNFRSNRSKRRRTTGYDDRVSKKKHRRKQKLGVINSNNGVDLNDSQKKVPRRVRRRNEFKENPESGFIASGDGTKRLRTHVWHAKRFTMTKMWGFHLPLGLHGSGMGSRALLKKFRDGVLVHDASYFGAVQLEGPQVSLVHMLTTIFVSGQLSQLEEISVLSGAVYGTAMLHSAVLPFSPAVAPVIYMWQPLRKQDDVTSRKLWVWIHASAFEEGYNALKAACQKEMEDVGVSINCISLQGKLAKLEVMGSKALEILQKILHPVTSNAENSWHLKKCSDEDSDMKDDGKKFSVFGDIPSSTIISLTVCDPRLIPDKKVELGLEKTPISNESHVEKNDDNYQPSEKIELWEINQGILPPVEENILCMEKQQEKLTFFCVGNTNSERQRASEERLSCRSCPIMLLKGSENKGSTARLSIILPLSWVRSFWGCLVSRGAHVIGLREKQWVASEAKLPCFPSDFPDCNSYLCYMSTKAAASEETLNLRPLAMRPFSIPILPPWESIKISINIEAIKPKNARSEELCEINAKGTLSQSGASFQFFVARTSKILAHFLSEIHGENLLLFPYSLDFQNDISEFMKNDERLKERSMEAASLINDNKKNSFVRVVIEAYRGGVFEEGAVVCAPNYSDITSCISRSDDEKEEIKIPQLSVRSYFQQQPSGKWEIQIPEDEVAKASRRWPIGFVTSGFVRGVKKPSATAFCEATLLACLREEQWNKTSMKSRRKEIYVLVRNLRSTTYKLALATIVLEQQENDLAFE